MNNLRAAGILFYGSASSRSANAADRDLLSSARPLFTDDEAGTDSFAAEGGAARWWLIDFDEAADGAFGADSEASVARAWDLCHRMVEDGGPGEGAIHAEPDLEYAFVPGGDDQGFAGDGGDKCPPSPGGNGLWYRDDEYGGFDAAAAAVARRRNRVRVVHMDTGYFEDFPALPQRLREAEARSFISGEAPDRAIDISSGVGTQRGHGSATMALLAGGIEVEGRTAGVAPFVHVVPFRVADRVYHIRTSSIARAFEEVHRLNRDARSFVHIVTMSMGGLPSQAWAEAVNRVYEDGTFIVTAAGNNVNGLPTVEVVYPARFERVVAATGVMHGFDPYDDLGLGAMTGNYGPASAMASALAAYTPQVPWTWRGDPPSPCYDGGGTSSATPQIAGAAALWIRNNREAYNRYDEPWQRVEAIRKALFDSADRNRRKIRDELEHYGHGALKADKAISVVPRATTLTKAPEADASWAFWRLLPNLFLDLPDAATLAPLALEASQLLLRMSLGAKADRLDELAAIANPSEAQAAERKTLWGEMAAALRDHPDASAALRRFLGEVAGEPARDKDRAPHKEGGDTGSVDWKSRAALLQALRGVAIPEPTHRLLRVYALDPSLQAQFDTFRLTEATLRVPWEEDLAPGPIGEYLEVIDIDPASNVAYAPVDLNDPRLLPVAGLAPSESNPQFHQQMVYAVAMLTIEHFEKALGRVALWAPRRFYRTTEDGHRERTLEYVQRLRIYPHALRRKNAYYSPVKKALLFGYFFNERNDRDNLPGGLVFNCLSHDIIAHETSHALLDGLHEHFAEPTNPDVLAFHEAFADIVAIFQHFTMAELLHDQIARTGGNLREENLLGKLAVQFGQARGRGALRDYLGRYVAPDGRDAATVPPSERVWKPARPTRNDYEDARRVENGQHALGAILVSAMLEAYLDVFEQETRDDILIATGGTGRIRDGELPVLLVDRLAERAADLAGRFLTISIRALDYCPPIDINFGDYLRAFVTADRDHSSDEDASIRVAVIAAFRERGITPDGVRHLSVDSVVWDPPALRLTRFGAVELLEKLDLTWSRHTDRRLAFQQGKHNVRVVSEWIRQETGGVPNLQKEAVAALGFYPENESVEVHLEVTGETLSGRTGEIEIHSVRPSVRAARDGTFRTDIVVEATQAWTVEKADGRPVSDGRTFRGGCTVLIDPATGYARYIIRKSVAKGRRIAGEMKMRRQLLEDAHHGLSHNYRFGDRASAHGITAGETFAILHEPSQRRGPPAAGAGETA